MSVDADTFRAVFGSWTTGVTIVTSRHEERVQGMTVSAFSEVSLDPPLVLVCADKSTITNELIEGSGVFSVSVLAEDQEALSNRFASKKYEHERFVGLDCAEGRTGCPRIPGAIAWIDCRVSQSIDAGDHWIYVGRIEDAEATDRAPLLYCRGRYHKLS